MVKPIVGLGGRLTSCLHWHHLDGRSAHRLLPFDLGLPVCPPFELPQSLAVGLTTSNTKA